jgi:TolB protein
LLVLALLLPACGQAPQAPLLRSLERKSGLIVYIGPDGNIYTIDQGGGNESAITDDAGSEGSDAGVHAYQQPTWSPDAKRLAFSKISVTSQGAFESARAYTAAPDGTGRVEAYNSDEAFPIYFYWSPDSERLSFLTSSQSGNLTLQLVRANGKDAQVLDTGSPYYWSWAPDSRSLLIHSGGSARTQSRAKIAFLNVDEDVAEEGLDLRPAVFQAPAWSPDGARLLVAAETEDGDQALMLTDRRGEVQRILALLEGFVAFSWSPDGEHLAYVANEVAGEGDERTVAQHLTVLDPDQPDEAQTAEHDSVFGFFWSPDSKQIAYFEPFVFAPTPDPNQRRQQEPIELLRMHVLDVDSGASREVTTLAPTEQFVQMLTFYDQYQRSATLWSPDSKNLVLSGFLLGSSDPNSDYGVWVAAATGNLEPRFLAEGVLAFWSWK